MPKMAASTDEVLFGNELNAGPSASGTYVKNKQLGKFLWNVLCHSVHERTDAEQLLADYLDQKLDRQNLKDGEVVFSSTEQLLDTCVHRDQTARCWGKRTSRSSLKSPTIMNKIQRKDSVELVDITHLLC